MKTHLLCLTIDTDPDGLSGPTVNRQSLEFNALEQLRKLPAWLLTSQHLKDWHIPVTWFVRADDQIQQAFGDPMHLFHRFFAPPHGTFLSVSGLDDARRSRGILDLGFAMKPGTVVSDISGDADRPGFIVTSGENRAEAIANAGEALSKIRFNML